MVKRFFVQSSLVAIACTSCVAAYAFADEAKAINVPAGELIPALKTLAEQSGIEVVYRSEQLDGLRTKGVSGLLTSQQATTKLLENTGLAVTMDPSGAMLVSPVKSARRSEAVSRSDDTKVQRSFWDGFRVAQVAQGETGSIAANPDGLDEIVVTAERRQSSLQKTGLSVAVRTGEDLLQQGRVTLAQILEDVPGVGTFPAANATQRVGSDMAGNLIAIRGVVANPVPAAAIQLPPSAAIYVDGVYEGIGGGYDITQAEILRGPQGTLYGRSATSGAIQIRTQNPDLQGFAADVLAEVGDHGLRHAAAGLNLPVDETVALRVSGNTYENDGYDISQGRFVTNNARVKLLWQPSEDISLLVGTAIEYNKTRSPGIAVNLVGPNAFDFGPIRSNTGAILADGNTYLPGKNNFRQYWAELNWNLGFATLTYLPSYRDWYQNSGVYGLGGINTYLRLSLHIPHDTFHIQELRLASNPGATLLWQAGGFYYHNDLRLARQANWVQSGTLNYDISASRETENTGMFGEATLPIGAALRLTGGVRYDVTKVSTDETYKSNAAGAAAATAPYDPNPTLRSASTGPDGRRTFRDTTFKARLEYDLTPRNLIYVMASSAFSPGDIQIVTQRIAGVTTPVVKPYREQKLTAYELGSKNRFVDDALQLNAALFYYDYGSYQVAVLTDPTLPASLQITNAPVRMIGGELETEFRLTAADRLSLNFAMTDARFTDLSGVGTAIDPRQKTVWNIIPASITAAYSHRFTLPGGSSLAARIDGRWLAAHDLSNVSVVSYNNGAYPFQRVGDVVIGDFNLGWNSSDDRYSLTGYVRNVADKRYKSTVSLTSTSGAGSASLSEPRTVGLVLSAHF